MQSSFDLHFKSGLSFFIFRFRDLPTQFFRVDENKYNDFSHLCHLFFRKIMSDHKGFSLYNKSGSKGITIALVKTFQILGLKT